LFSPIKTAFGVHLGTKEEGEAQVRLVDNIFERQNHKGGSSSRTVSPSNYQTLSDDDIDALLNASIGTWSDKDLIDSSSVANNTETAFREMKHKDNIYDIHQLPQLGTGSTDYSSFSFDSVDLEVFENDEQQKKKATGEAAAASGAMGLKSAKALLAATPTNTPINLRYATKSQPIVPTSKVKKALEYFKGSHTLESLSEIQKTPFAAVKHAGH
jgi:hypothetical protein